MSMAGRAFAAPITITNAGFETGDFTGRTTTPAASGSLFGVSTANPHSGSFAAFFGGTSTGFYDSISQTLTTTLGSLITVSFWLANNGGPNNNFQALWDGNVLFSLLNSVPFAYTLESFNVTAAGSSSLLTFRSYQVPAFFYLDDISANTVPEPATLTLTAFGLAGVAARLRRRRNLQS
jgi:hypothetical protein